MRSACIAVDKQRVDTICFEMDWHSINRPGFAEEWLRHDSNRQGKATSRNDPLRKSMEVNGEAMV